jgi:hypothetical protein
MQAMKYKVTFHFETIIDAKDEESAVELANKAAIEYGFDTECVPASADDQIAGNDF